MAQRLTPLPPPADRGKPVALPQSTRGRRVVELEPEAGRRGRRPEPIVSGERGRVPVPEAGTRLASRRLAGRFFLVFAGVLLATLLTVLAQPVLGQSRPTSRPAPREDKSHPVPLGELGKLLDGGRPRRHGYRPPEALLGLRFTADLSVLFHLSVVGIVGLGPGLMVEYSPIKYLAFGVAATYHPTIIVPDDKQDGALIHLVMPSVHLRALFPVGRAEFFLLHKLGWANGPLYEGERQDRFLFVVMGGAGGWIRPHWGLHGGPGIWFFGSESGRGLEFMGFSATVSLTYRI